MSNEQDNHLNDSNLNDYETNINDSKGFFATLLDKLKKNTQKTLPSGDTDKIRVTSSSVTSMWGVGNVRKYIVNVLDSVRKTVFKSKEPQVQNGFDTVIIGKDDKSKDNNPEKLQDTEKSKLPPKQVIFPKSILNNNIQAQNTQMASNSEGTTDTSSSTSNSQGTLGVSTIDTSAVKKQSSTLTVGTIKIDTLPEKDDELAVEEPDEHDIDF